LGNVKLSFSLSPAGERMARTVKQRLAGKTIFRKTATRDRTREQSLLRFVRSNKSFIRYRSSPESFVPTKSEIYTLAFSTLDTPLRVVKQNLHQFLEVALEEGDREMQGFMKAVLASLGKKNVSDGGGG